MVQLWSPELKWFKLHYYLEFYELGKPHLHGQVYDFRSN